MKFLHTADWHIGQLFHDFDRSEEHEAFLNTLLDILQKEQIDALLISGDVFDLSNPAAHSIRLFYQFLQRATFQMPHLQIVITAGNHDSPTRLEAPKPLLQESNIHIIGTISRLKDGEIDFDALTIPLKDAKGKTTAWCLAIPFLRVGDYPHLPESNNPYTAGVTAFYKEAFEHVMKKRKKGQAIIAMGHLHAQKAEITEMDSKERLIMGGVESIGADAFANEIAYVALGHIHKAQQISKPTIRYSGSPIPMSFSERNYVHQVVVCTLAGEDVQDMKFPEIPVTIPVISVPVKHSPLSNVLLELERLPEYKVAPYLEVRVLEDQPEPGMRMKIEKVLEEKNVRLASINLKRVKNTSDNSNSEIEVMPELEKLKPTELLEQIYESKYNTPPPKELISLFEEIVVEVQTETE